MNQSEEPRELKHIQTSMIDADKRPPEPKAVIEQTDLAKIGTKPEAKIEPASVTPQSVFKATSIDLVDGGARSAKLAHL